MYDITDTSSAVREVQRYLLELFYSGDSRIHVAVDGIYDDRTRTAVKEFQRNYDLPVTGEVDSVTWDRLYLAYRLAYDQRQADAGIPPDISFPVSVGSRGEGVKTLQLAISQMAIRYRIDIPVEPTGLYSYATAEAVTRLQKIYGFTETGRVDAAFYELLLADQALPPLPPKRS